MDAQTPGAAGAETDAVERLLFECLERMEAEGQGAVDALLERHPEHAEAVESELARLDRAGLLRPAGDGATAVPERLGDFRLLRRLGAGGMGFVYEAEQLSLSRSVAVKVIRPELLFFEGTRERFRREVEAIARMQHPGIVPVYTLGEEGGIPYVAMELFDGCTLADVLRELRDRDPDQLDGGALADAVERSVGASSHAAALFEGSWTEACLRLTRDVAEALEHVHSRGIIHRDVKPSNIAITRAGRGMLFDFGLALGRESQRLTRSGSRPGSLPYMSPEQLRGDRDLDGRTDVWSLGVTLYELLTLRQPFEAGSSAATSTRILGGRFERPRRLRRRLPADVETVVLAALEPEPERRYATAGDFARDLSNLLARRPIEARKPGIALRILRWGQRHPRSSAATLAAIPLTLFSLGALGFMQARGRRTEAGLRASAEQQHARILRLSDLKRLDELVVEAASLFPRRPERAPELEAWLERAQELLQRLPLHRESMAELEQAAGYTPTGELRFATTEERWHHENLRQLTARLEELQDPERGLVADVIERLAWAQTVGERSVSSADARARWARASASVANVDESPLYGGLELPPQIGLLPIGQDPASGLWEFAHVQSGREARRRADGTLQLDEETGIVLVLIPGGRATTGNQNEDPGEPYYDSASRDMERPLVEVELEPFFLSKYEVTQAQWERVTGTNPSLFSRQGGAWQHEERRPVENVSWDDSRAFVTQLDLSLPTSAQWEYAARAGTTSAWWTGETKESLRFMANLADLAAVRVGAPYAGLCDDPERDDGFPHTSPVDAFAPNPFGLHDMLGNVWEYCIDSMRRVRERTLRAGDGRDLGPEYDEKVLRGGAYSGGSERCRSAASAKSIRSAAVPDSGLRPARPLER